MQQLSPTMSRDTTLINTFLGRVYGWMFAGLGVTALVAFGVTSSPNLLAMLMQNPLLFWGAIIAEFLLVLAISARVQKLEPGVAMGLFLLYSALNGMTLSLVLLAYTGAAVAGTFVITAGMFGATALYGATTRRNLSGAGAYLFMALIGLILASVVGVFWHSSVLQMAISVAGVLIFTGLTAYDAQRLKTMALSQPGDRTTSSTIVGALALYLDFINLFLFLLRLFGNRSNN